MGAKSAEFSATGRPAGRLPTVGFSTARKAIDWVVDRGSQTESKTLYRSTEPVDRNKQRALLLLPVDRVSRLKCTHAHWCMSIERQSSFALPAVDHPVDLFPNVENPTVGGRMARSTGSRQSLLTGYQRLYPVLFFVGVSPNESIGFSNPVFIPYK